MKLRWPTVVYPLKLNREGFADGNPLELGAFWSLSEMSSIETRMKRLANPNSLSLDPFLSHSPMVRMPVRMQDTGSEE